MYNMKMYGVCYIIVSGNKYRSLANLECHLRRSHLLNLKTERLVQVVIFSLFLQLLEICVVFNIPSF